MPIDHHEFLHYEVQDLEILHLYSSIPEIFAGIFCRHYPQTKHTVVADTPEQRRIAENTKIQSNVSKDGSISGIFMLIKWAWGYICRSR